jgi:dienelactone hydrolase
MTGRAWLIRVVALVGVAAAPLVTGCAAGSAGRPSGPAAISPSTATTTAAAPSLPPSAAGRDCASDAVAGRQVRFGTGGALGGVVYGTGKVGLVLAHQHRSDMCNWAAHARELGQRGYRALAFDFSGSGSSSSATNDVATDVSAAVAFLRGEGVGTVVLMGASKGGTAVLAAGAEVRPPVAGVISLSGPQTWQGVSARDAAPRLSVPVLYVVGERDTNFVADARALYDATPAAVRTLVVVDTASHGVGLLNGDQSAADAPAKKVRAEIDAFLAKVAPAT